MGANRRPLRLSGASPRRRGLVSGAALRSGTAHVQEAVSRVDISPGTGLPLMLRIPPQ